MNTKQLTTSSTALFRQPERPIRYVNAVTLPDGSVGYDRPLENYFDTSMTPYLLPSHPPSNLYDTIARAHDSRFQVSPDAFDPSAPTPPPLLLNQPERPRTFANLNSDSPDYMGISPLVPEWRPRRSSYEDRRGALGVIPFNVNVLVPPEDPPIQCNMSPRFKAWLDALPTPVLVKTQPVIEVPQPTTESTPIDDDCFNYDSDSSVEIIRAPAPPPHAPQPRQEPDPESDPYDSDSDTDSESDHEYSYKFTPLELCRGNPEGLRWLIFPKRPSVEPEDAMDTTPLDNTTARKRRGRKPKSEVTNVPKRNANDTPTRRSQRISARRQSHPEPRFSAKHAPPAQASSPTAMELDHVRMASPSAGSQSTSLNPKKPFRCLLDGCNQTCATPGDLYRHQKSLRHSTPSYACSFCGNSFTRSDALKRHLKNKSSCKKLRTTRPGGHADGEPMQTEADSEAT